jgi:hypothetical protein
LISLGLAFWPSWRGAPLAYAQVVEQFEKTKTMKALGESHLMPPYDKGVPMRIFVKGTRSRCEEGDGSNLIITIADSTKGEMLALNASSHYAEHRIVDKSVIGDMVGMFEELIRTASKPLGDKVIDGKRLTGFGGTVPMPRPGGQSDRIPGEVWVDGATKLPVRIELKDPDSNKVMLAFHDIQFDLPVDDALLEMTPPKDYKVTESGLRADQLKPAATTRDAEAWTLRPGIGIGDVKFGATREQVVALLGAPEEEPEGEMRYPSKGLQLFIEPDSGLYIIVADASRRVGWNSHDFSGKTDKGIGMGSAEKDVEAAYGPPDKPADAKTGDMEYGRLGMTILLDPDGVTEIWMQLPSPQSTSQPAK